MKRRRATSGAELDPTSALANFDLGQLARLQGEHDREIGYYRGAIELSPALAQAHGSLGTLLASLNR